MASASSGTTRGSSQALTSAQIQPGVPALVGDLVRAVGRTFYRDEFSVVLDRLSRELLIRDDDLTRIFGLPHKQLRTILMELIEERVVCSEEITEKLRSKRDARLDVETQLANLKAAVNDPKAAERKRKRKRGRNAIHYSDDDDDDDDSDDSTDDEEIGISEQAARAVMRPGDRAAAAAAAEKKRKRRARRRVKTTCYYINPRYFTDVVKYRIHLMRKHLENLSLVREGSENVYRCGNSRCTFECTLLEAEERRQSILAAKRNPAQYKHQSGVGAIRNTHTMVMMNSSSASSSSSSSSSYQVKASDYDYTCPLCESTLNARMVENVASAAARLLVKFSDQMRQSGIPDLIKTLDSVPLGANRPSDTIKMGTITLHGPQSAPNATPSTGEGEGGGGGDQTTQNASNKDIAATTTSGQQSNQNKDSSSSSSSSSSTSAGAGRVFLKKKDQLEVYLEGDVSAKTKNGKRQTGGGSASHEGVPQTVSVESLPSFLTRSTKTGEETRSFGFMAINKGSGLSSSSSSSSSSSAAFAIESNLSSIAVIDMESEEALARRERALASETGEEGHWQEKRAGGAEGFIIAELEEATAQAFDTDLNAFARRQQRDMGKGEGVEQPKNLGVEEEEEVWEDA